MTIKSSGQLGMNEIHAEFALGNNLNVHRGTQFFLDNGSSGNFSSGQIDYDDFYDKRKTNPVAGGSQEFAQGGTLNANTAFTVPNYNTLSVTCEGPAGNGATGCAGTFNGGAGGRSTRTFIKDATGSPAVGSTINVGRNDQDTILTFLQGMMRATIGAVVLRGGPGGTADGGTESGGGGRGGGVTCTGGSNGIAGHASGTGATNNAGGSARANGAGRVIISWS